MSEFDENGDGILNSEDSIFNKLMIWQDLNQNGISEEGELKSLKEHRIIGLKLTDIQAQQSTIAGSTLRKTMTYLYEETITNEEGEEIISKKEGTIGEFLLAKDNIDTHDTQESEDALSQLDLSKEEEAALYHTIKSLPDIRSFGRMKRLHNAMVLDQSGVLVELVQQFQNSTNSTEKENLLEQILLFMAEATDVDASSKGQYANAKHIKVLEHAFDNPLREGVLDKRLGQTYEDAYHDIKSVYYTTLSMQTGLKDMQEFFLAKENKLVNISLLNQYLGLKLLEEAENADFLFEETTKVLLYLNSLGIEGFHEFKEYFGDLSTDYLHKFAELNAKQYNENGQNGTVYLYTKGVTIHAGDGNDTIQGTFNGRSGDDYIYAGKGNDTICGGVGSDTYFFEKGDGQDTIHESITAKDTNIVVFGEGIQKENLQIKRLNHNDVELFIKDTNDKLTIRGQIQMNEKGAIDRFFFFDGEQLTYEELKTIANTSTEGNDYLTGTKENDEIHASEGDDILYGEGGNDTLYGNNGKDKLYGEDGSDTLVGGESDDYLNGGYGADTYLFRKGDGIDTIEEYDSNTKNVDKIQLDYDVQREDILLNRNGNDLEITFKDSNDKIIVKNQFSSAYNTVEEIRYGDSKTITFQEMLDATNQNSQKEHLLKGAYTDDIFVGSDEADTIYGYDGADHLTGGKGDDTLDGGYGNDTYYYNKGDGTDTITDNSGDDTLKLGDGVGMEDVIFTRINDRDITMSIKGTQDKVILKNQANSGVINKVEFHDGSILTYDQIKTIVNTPTDRDDYIEGSNQADTIRLLDGNDTVYAGAGNDTVYGEAGSDKIYAGDGEDVLEGGTGDDYLNGGYGADTYVFRRGDGADIIEDYDSRSETIDKIVLKDINLEDVYFTKESEDDITIKVKNSEDKITIKNAHNMYDRIEEVHFADGSKVTYQDIMGKAFEYFGDDGDNTIKTYRTADEIRAGSGDDKLYGGDGADKLYGEDGADKLYGENGDDRLEGGDGSDYLNGGRGSDTYVFGRGDGVDTIDDQEGYYQDINTIQFKDGIQEKDLFVNRINDTDIEIQIIGTEDKLIVKNVLSYTCGIKEIQFSNGTKWDLAKIQDVSRRITYMTGDNVIHANTYENYIIQTGDGKDRITSSDGDDTIYAGDGDNVVNTGKGEDVVHTGSGADQIQTGDGNDIIYAGEGEDTIEAGEGSDTLTGGKGNDRLIGGRGSDTYIFSRGDGTDTIEEDRNTWSNDKNSIVFQEGITQEDITLVREGNNIKIRVYSKDKQSIDNEIIVKDGFMENESRMDNIRFADGTIWNKEKIEEIGKTIRGTQENDLISGYSWDERMIGNQGDDTYLFGYEQGQDIIEEEHTEQAENHIEIADDIRQEDIQLIRQGDDLIVQLNVQEKHDYYNQDERLPNLPEGSKLTVKNYFAIPSEMQNSQSGNLRDIRFSDGSILTKEQIIEQCKHIYGSVERDELNGFEWDDIIYASHGDDILYGGKGDDILEGYTGSDTYVFDRGDGEDTIIDNIDYPGNPSTDTIAFGEGISREDIKIYREANSLIVEVYSKDKQTVDNKIIVKDDFKYIHRAIEQILFHDGTILSKEDIYQESKEILGTDESEHLKGFQTDDILNGKKGDDVLEGHIGSDTYVFAKGDGEDTIIEVDTVENNSIDTILLKEDIQENDVRIKRKGYHLVVEVIGEENQLFNRIIVQNHFANPYGTIEQIRFANGTVWTKEEIEEKAATIYGTEQGETISLEPGDYRVDAGAGNDTIIGNAGSGIYVFDRGYGHNTITDAVDYSNGPSTDTIEFKEGITEEDIRIRRNGYHMVIEILSEDKQSVDTSITIKNEYAYQKPQIEQIRFANGTIWSADYMKEKAQNNGAPTYMNIQSVDNNGSLLRELIGENTIAQREDSKDAKETPAILETIGETRQETSYVETQFVSINHQVEQLVQAMAGFSQEKGVSWSKAIEERPREVEAVVQNFWVKQI